MERNGDLPMPSNHRLQPIETSLLVLFILAMIIIDRTRPDPVETVVDVPASIENIIVTPPNPSKHEVDANEVHCLALNIWHESRGTSLMDQLSVAHVTKNRELSSKYPSGICDVVFQGKHAKNSNGQSYPLRYKCQFSWYCDGRSDKIRLTDDRGVVIKDNVKLWESIQHMSFDVLAGYTEDPTDGATHYMNPRIVKHIPRWAREFVMVHETTGHKFYRM